MLTCTFAFIKLLLFVSDLRRWLHIRKGVDLCGTGLRSWHSQIHFHVAVQIGETP